MYNNACSNCGKKFTALSEDEKLCGECRKMKDARTEQQKQSNADSSERTGIDGGRLYQFEDAYRDEFNEQERREKFAKRMRIAIYAVGVVIIVASIAVILLTHEWG